MCSVPILSVSVWVSGNVNKLFLLQCRNYSISTKPENVELKNGELTRAGFLELNQMEAEDNQGDTDDLWVTLSNMGYNKGLNVDEVSDG